MTKWKAENSTDQGRLFRATEKLLALRDDPCFSEYSDNSLLANDTGKFFFLKIDKIRNNATITKKVAWQIQLSYGWVVCNSALY